MNKKKLLIAFLLAFSMTTGISYAEEENIISPKVEINDEQLSPKIVQNKKILQKKLTKQKKRTKNNQKNNQKRKNTRKFLRTKT